jgi:hypothetical protein
MKIMAGSSCEEDVVVEVVWQEFTRSGGIVTKRKQFRDVPGAVEKFVERLDRKDNFYRVLTIGYELV